MGGEFGRSNLIRRALVVLALAIVALGALATSAQASSIFFIRSNDVWVANPDGSNARQLTTDGGNGQPYVSVSAAKSSETLAYLRDNPGGSSPRLAYGTMNPDGTGSTINPDDANMQPQGGFDGKTVSIDNAGDRIAWPKSYLFCFNFTCNTEFAPYSEGVDGTNQQHIVGGQATNVTFGDPAGQTLLFNDLGIGSTWGDQPGGCASTTTRYVLVRQTPAPTGSKPGIPSVYCVPNLDLVAPALRPDGQVIAAVQSDNLGAGTQSIVTMPIAAVATDSTSTPVTQVTSPGSAETPDFSPDGTQLAFEGAGDTIDTVSASGGAPTQILTNATSPAWSPYTLPGGQQPGGQQPGGQQPGGQQPGGQQPGGQQPGGSGPTAHRCTVPKLTGETVSQARTALTRAGCKLGRTRTAFSSRVKRGRVISQSPKPRTVAAAGTRVAITVSRGKKH